MTTIAAIILGMGLAIGFAVAAFYIFMRNWGWIILRNFTIGTLMLYVYKLGDSWLAKAFGKRNGKNVMYESEINSNDVPSDIKSRLRNQYEGHEFVERIQ